MPQGNKDAYTDKQKRMAEHIEAGYEKRGTPKETAEARAWATVNKETDGGRKSGSGRKQAEDHASSRQGGHSGSGNPSDAKRSEAARKGWQTRRRRAG